MTAIPTTLDCDTALNFDGDPTVEGVITIDGDTTLDGDISVIGDTTFESNATLNCDNRVDNTVDGDKTVGCDRIF